MSVTAVPLQPTKKSHIFWLWAALILGVLLAVALAWQGTGRPRALKGSNDQFLAWNKGQPGVVTTASGLQYQVLKEGDGPNPTENDVVAIGYRGTLRDGTVFDQTTQQPAVSPLARFVPGFSESLKHMRKGGSYRVWIKPEIGYGANSPDPARIPPNSLLIFDVQMLGFIPLAQYQQMQMQQMMQQQGAGGPGGAGGPPPQ
jgi:hypothetical protein